MVVSLFSLIYKLQKNDACKMQVQNLIERCLIFHMSQDQCIKALAEHAGIKPLVTITGSIVFSLLHTLEFACAYRHTYIMKFMLFLDFKLQSTTVFVRVQYNNFRSFYNSIKIIITTAF